MKYLILLVLMSSTAFADENIKCERMNIGSYTSEAKVYQCSDKSTMTIFANNTITRVYPDKSVLITYQNGGIKMIDSTGKMIFNQ